MKRFHCPGGPRCSLGITKNEAGLKAGKRFGTPPASSLQPGGPSEQLPRLQASFVRSNPQRTPPDTSGRLFSSTANNLIFFEVADQESCDAMLATFRPHFLDKALTGESRKESGSHDLPEVCASKVAASLKRMFGSLEAFTNFAGIWIEVSLLN